MDKKYILALSFSSLFVATQAFAAADFTIAPTPGTTLPTTVPAGSSVSASYTVTNNTSTTRSGYVIKGLPLTVTQNSSSNLNCPNPINLAGYASCVLKLTITGEAKTSFALCRGTSCTTARVPLNVTVSGDAGVLPMIAAGNYSNGSVGELWLASSLDNGVTWSYKITGDNPPPSLKRRSATRTFLRSTSFNSSSCTASSCIAVGMYAVGATFPVVATSTDSGGTWAYTITKNQVPAGYTDGTGFQGSNCNGSTCVAVGAYRDATSTYPMAATSNDNGSNWTYTLTSTTLPSGIFDMGEFRGTNCNGSACVAVGDYQSNGKSFGLIATSTTNGLSWSYTLDATQVPGDYASGNRMAFNDVSCNNDNICVAGGYYPTSTDTYPLLATSTDGGAHWTYTLTSTNKPGDLVSTDKGFTSVSCSENSCVAAGTYNDGSGDFPMIATSNSAGAGWTFTLTSANLPSDGVQASLVSVSCTGTTCVASGGYQASNSTGYPLVATSSNSGATWSYTLTSSQIPGDLDDKGNFVSASCVGTRCTVAGSYQTTTTTFPLLALSTNNGLTWTYKVTSTTPTLPDPFYSGVFTSTSIGSSAFLPDSLKFIINSK